MTTKLAAAALSAALLLGGAAASAPGAVEQLDWLSGAWTAEREGRWTEEHWIPPRGGIMLGVNRSGSDGGASSFEFLRIQADAAGVTYWAMPRGGAAVPFRLRSLDTRHVVFENPEHDYPTRIEYRRHGNELEATISGPGGARPMTWRWTRRP